MRNLPFLSTLPESRPSTWVKSIHFVSNLFPLQAPCCSPLIVNNWASLDVSMSASYLLDEDPGEDNTSLEFDLQRAREGDAKTSIACSHEDEPEYYQTLYSPTPIDDTVLEYACVDFPSTARFMPVNAHSVYNRFIPSTLPPPSAAPTHTKRHQPKDVSEVRSMILAATRFLDKSSSKKRKGTTAPVLRKRNTENKKELPLITVAEGLAVHQAQPTGGLEVVEMHSTRPRTVHSPTVLGQLSEKTLNKLQAFVFKPPVGHAVASSKTPCDGSDKNTISGECLTHLQPDESIVGDENKHDDFDLDEDIFDNIYTEDATEHQTSDCTAIVTSSSNVEPPFSKPKSPQVTPPEEPSTSHQLAQSKTLQKPIQRSLIPLSPFLRSSLPQPAPVQSLIPSLIPHRRIPTLFRIAEVHRLLATLPPEAPPQRIELYATVTSSHRCFDKKIQEFTFADLFFPHRPPYLRGAYTAWRLCQLFDTDSAPFLEPPNGSKLCRAIVQVTKNSTTGNARRTGSSPLRGFSGSQGGVKEGAALEAEVLNIWEATWEDVEYAKGIVGA